MTRKEITNNRDLTFSNWIRSNLPDSSTGYMVSDLDFILQNYKTKKVMLLEIKTRNTKLKPWQSALFSNLNNWIKKGIEEDWDYLGFNVIRFENTNFEDGKCYYNNQEIEEGQLKELLNF